MIRRISQGGRVTDTHHDELGQVSEIISRASEADPEDPPNTGDEVTTYLRDDAGNVLQETGPDGLVTRFAYDPLNRLVKTCWGEGDDPEPDTEPDSTEPGCVSQFFDAAGRLTDSVDELGNLTTFVHDEAGRQVQVMGPDPDGAGPADRPVFETRHDALGRVAWTRDPRGVFTTHEYDDADRELSTCLAEDEDDDHELDPEETLVECTTFEHDESGRRVAEVDALGHRTSHVFNDAGQHVGVIDELDHETTYAYNGFGELVSWTDALGRTTRLEYDNAGHRTARILPMLQREEWTYDDAGKVTSHRDFEGRVTTFEHDVFGRLEHVDYPRNPDVTYTYWPGGARHEVTIEGSDPVTYEYDGYDPMEPGHGRRWLSRIATPDYAIEHEHDAAGNRTLTRTIVPQASGPDDEHEVEYEFDGAGRLWKVVESSTAQAEYGYDAASLLASVTYANGVEGSFAPDLAGRLKTITWTNATTTLASFDWTFDAAGRRESVAELGGKTVNYVHDDVNRLIREEHLSGATCVRDIAYEYDSVGNRTSMIVECATMSPEVTTYAHDENDRMLSAGVEVFTYDHNGNTLTAGATTYEWDDENRLIGADTGEAVLEFEYDADGIRQATTRHAVRTVHVVDGSWTYPQVVEERDAAGDLVRRYLRGYQAIRQDDASPEWLMQDHLGSTRALADGAGDLLDAIDYEAFGTAMDEEDAAGVGLRFAGEEWEEGLGAVYLRARWMTPRWGGFTSSDPIERVAAGPSTASSYSYAAASPVDLIDPRGEMEGSIGVDVFGSIVGLTTLAKIEDSPATADSDEQIPFPVAFFVIKGTSWTALDPSAWSSTAAAASAMLLDAADVLLRYADATFVDDSAMQVIDVRNAGPPDVETDDLYAAGFDGCYFAGNAMTVILTQDYDMPGHETGGYTLWSHAAPNSGLSSIRFDVSAYVRARTLAHEMGHAGGHLDEYRAGPKENLMTQTWEGGVGVDLQAWQRRRFRANVLAGWP